MSKITAYHGKPELKAEIVADMRLYIDAGCLGQSAYWDGESGCLVGCTLDAQGVARAGMGEKESHDLYANISGFPPKMIFVIDRLFTALPEKECQNFCIAVLEAIRPNADLEHVVSEWLTGVVEGGEYVNNPSLKIPKGRRA